jgi:hypothetical protein
MSSGSYHQTPKLCDTALKGAHGFQNIWQKQNCDVACAPTNFPESKCSLYMSSTLFSILARRSVGHPKRIYQRQKLTLSCRASHLTSVLVHWCRHGSQQAWEVCHYSWWDMHIWEQLNDLWTYKVWSWHLFVPCLDGPSALSNFLYLASSYYKNNYFYALSTVVDQKSHLTMQVFIFFQKAAFILKNYVCINLFT